MKVKEIMTAPVVTVTEDTAVSAVAAVLHGRRISAVPVHAAQARWWSSSTTWWLGQEAPPGR